MSMNELFRWLRAARKKVNPVAVVEIMAALVKLKIASTPEQKYRAIVELARAVARLFR